MAVLSNAVRGEICATFQREKSAVREAIAALSKADLLAAVGAVDAWIDANAAAFNNALPAAAKANLTAQQKIDLFLYVLLRRVKG
jgi:hypothetical protein